MSRLRLQSGGFRNSKQVCFSLDHDFPIGTEMLEIHKCLHSVAVHNYPSTGKKLSREIHKLFYFPFLGESHSFLSHYAMRLVSASSKLDSTTKATGATCFGRKLSSRLQVIPS